jgi:ABC-type glycerol-3-phosphate transport system substrate-binding protein
VVKSATAQTFTYWDWWDPVSNPTFAAWFKYARAAWAQQYPQVALDIVTIPAAGIDDYPNKFIAAVAGNDTPDALHMSVAYARDLWDKGTLLDISSMVARTPSIAADQFIPAAAFYNQADGKIFGTPVEGPSGYGIAYNVAHFQEIGATPTWETTSAWSWQTFADTAAKLVQKDSSGVTRIGYLDSTPSLEYFCEWLYTQGGTFYAPDLKSVQFDQPRGVDALQFTLDLMDRYATSGPLPKGVTNLQYFYQGHISMMPMGLYLINNVHTAAPTLQWDLMPFPKGPAGAGPATDIFVNMDSVPKESKAQDLALNWMAFYSGPTVQAQRSAVAALPSPRKDVYTSPQWKAAVASIPQNQRVLDIAQLPAVGPYPYFRLTQLTGAWTPIITDTFAHKIPAGQALQQAQQQMNSILKS